ncbi:MAG: sugar kinase [Deinococcota bacterium]
MPSQSTPASTADASERVRPWQVLCLGEAMLRLAATPGERLEQSNQLDVFVAGSELNVACLLARLGTRASWVSSLPDSILGRMVTHTAHGHGVDTSGVTWLDSRLGLLFTESGAAPRPGQVVYDRADSAASQMSIDDRDWAALVAQADVLHLSGITPALSESCAELCEHVASLAASAGTLVSFDPNYRSRLWSVAEANAYCKRILPKVDVLAVSERDARSLLDVDGELDDIALELQARWQLRAALITAGETSRQQTGHANALAWAMSSDSQATLTHGPAFEVDVVDRIGAGDSSVAGLLVGVLRNDANVAASYSAALSALALASSGDINWATEADVQTVLAATAGSDIQR